MYIALDICLMPCTRGASSCEADVAFMVLAHLLRLLLHSLNVMKCLVQFISLKMSLHNQPHSWPRDSPVRSWPPTGFRIPRGTEETMRIQEWLVPDLPE